MKGLIKDILVMALIVLPVHGCYGEMLSIRELAGQENTRLEWNQTYEAHGRTIQIHVPVIIPEVDRFPIIRVSAWMGSEVVENLELPEAPDQTNAGIGIFYEDAAILSYLDENHISGEAATVYHIDPEKDDQAMLQVFHRDPLAQRLGKWWYTSDCYYPYEVSPEAVFAEDNELSLADAENALQKLLAYYYGDACSDAQMDYVEIRGRARKKNGNDWGDYKKDYPKGTYCLHYRQKMEGIPIYLDIGSKILTTSQTKVSQEVALKWGRIPSLRDVNYLEFMDDSSFFWNAVLFKEKDFIEQDVPLASLDEIIARLEQEISEGRLRDVYALRLGYVCYLDENSPDTYTLYPAWICDCIYAESPKQEIEIPDFSDAFRDNFCYEQMVIDAQTCEIQAGWIAEDEGLFHAAPITWNPER